MLRQVVLLIGPPAGCDEVRGLLGELGYSVGLHCPSLAELPADARLDELDLAVCVVPGEESGPPGREAFTALTRVPTVFVVAEQRSGEAWAQTPELVRRGFGLLAGPVNKADLLWEIQVATEKWHTSERLRDRSELNRATLRAIRDAVLTIDRNEVVLFMNDAAEAMTGVPLQEALGQHYGDVAPLFSITEAVCTRLVDLAMISHASGDPDDATLLLRGADGRERYVRATLSPIEVTPPQGGPATTGGYVMVLRDVTEERRLQGQVILMDRLASVGTMAAGVAHEINNPLACVISNLEFVTERVAALDRAAANDEERAALAELALALKDAAFGAERAAEVVHNMRALAGTHDGAAEIVDVAATVDAAVRLTAHEYRAGAPVAADLAAGLTIRGDRGSLVQVLVNLLVNAAHATRGRGEHAHVAVSTREVGGQVVVTVADNGAGMAPETVARIFDPFFTTKPAGQGTGLGLSIAHTLMARQHGTIAVKSELGVGTEFTLRLPRTA